MHYFTKTNPGHWHGSPPGQTDSSSFEGRPAIPLFNTFLLPCRFIQGAGQPYVVISTVSLLQENLSERGAGGLLEELCLLLSNCGRLSVVPWLPAPLASLPYLLSFPTHHRGQTAWTGRTGAIRQYCQTVALAYTQLRK